MNTDFSLNSNLNDKVAYSAPVQKTVSSTDIVRPVNQPEKPEPGNQPLAEDKAKILSEKETKKQDEDANSLIMDADELRTVLDEINSALYSYNRGLRFEIHEKTDDIIVRVMNTKTDEIIRQYPSEDVLKRREQLIRGETLSLITQVD